MRVFSSIWILKSESQMKMLGQLLQGVKDFSAYYMLRIFTLVKFHCYNFVKRGKIQFKKLVRLYL